MISTKATQQFHSYLYCFSPFLPCPWYAFDVTSHVAFMVKAFLVVSLIAVLREITQADARKKRSFSLQDTKLRHAKLWIHILQQWTWRTLQHAAGSLWSYQRSSTLAEKLLSRKHGLRRFFLSDNDSVDSGRNSSFLSRSISCNAYWGVAIGRV